MVDLSLFLYTGFALLLVVGIVVIGPWLLTHMPPPLATLRAWWQEGMDQQRARYERRAIVYGLRDMSSERSGSVASAGGSGTGSGEPALRQQNQENRELVLDIEGAIAFLSRQNMTSEQAAAVLAVLRRDTGDYFLSANKIRDAVGGSDATIKAEVAARRPRAEAKPPRGRRLERPLSGW